MSRIECFEDIEAWQKAREMVRCVYEYSKLGEFAKDYALKDQIRRACISIMSNIAEGFERDGDKEFMQFLSIAKGSCGEVRSHLYAALDQQYISAEQFKILSALAMETSRMISGFMKYLRDSDKRGSKFK
jgi:four helix bundle protein